MSGGRQAAGVKPWSLGAETLVYTVLSFGALIVPFILPEGVRIGLLVVYDVFFRTKGLTWWGSDWLVDLLSYGISAVIFTSIIRFVVLSEGPSWLPSPRLVANYLATAAVLIVVSVIVDFITGSWLSINLYRAFLMETPYDDLRFLKWHAAYSVTGFFLSAVLIAAIYPALGMTALYARIDLRRLLRWGQKYFWRFLVLALLLMSVCLLLQRAYWWLLRSFVPNLTTDAYYVEHENVRTVVEQMTYVPMDILFDIVPAVTIGLLYRVLRAGSADL